MPQGRTTAPGSLGVDSFYQLAVGVERFTRVRHGYSRNDSESIEACLTAYNLPQADAIWRFKRARQGARGLLGVEELICNSRSITVIIQSRRWMQTSVPSGLSERLCASLLWTVSNRAGAGTR